MNVVSAQVIICCVYDRPKKIMQHMDGNIPFMFYCWADPGVHLLLLKSSMDYAMGPNLTVG